MTANEAFPKMDPSGALSEAVLASFAGARRDIVDLSQVSTIALGRLAVGIAGDDIQVRSHGVSLSAQQLHASVKELSSGLESFRSDTKLASRCHRAERYVPKIGVTRALGLPWANV